MKKYVMALDQGTTSSRTVLYDVHGETVGIANKSFAQHYPKPGWVEHDAIEIWTSQLATMKEVLQKADVCAVDIAAIGITNQRESVVVWEKDSGKPIHPAICWQCRRTAEICAGWTQDGMEPLIREKTGLVIDPYFSGSKIKWILDLDPVNRSRAEKGELLAGTIDTWLVWQLTGGRVHVTDCSNASRTMLFDIHRLRWDDDLCHLMDIPKGMLPEVVPSSGIVGYTDRQWLGAEIPIAGIAGDQQAALFGQGCRTAGTLKNTYGTGCFLLMNTGDKPVMSQNRLLTTLAWDIGKGPVYALEGGVFHAGSAIQWLQEGMEMVGSGKEADILAETVADCSGVVFVPAFTGLGAPWWDMYAAGTMIGITRGTTKAHMVRAVLESIAFQSLDVVDAMVSDAGKQLRQLRVDGGVSKSSFLMQFQANLLGVEVLRPVNIETTAAGAAALASLAIGLSDADTAGPGCATGEIFHPKMARGQAMEMHQQWKRAVKRSLGWYSGTTDVQI